VKAYIKLDISFHGVPVVIPTNNREIPGSTPGRYNLQNKITSVGRHERDGRNGHDYTPDGGKGCAYPKPARPTSLGRPMETRSDSAPAPPSPHSENMADSDSMTPWVTTKRVAGAAQPTQPDKHGGKKQMRSPHTGSRRVTFDEVALSNLQGQGVADTVSTPLHASPTPVPPGSIPTHLVTVGPGPHASDSGFSGLPTYGRSDCNDTAPVEIANDRPWPPHQDTRDLDRATHRQRLSNTFSPLPPATSCGPDSPEPLARPLVAPSELTQVTDLLALFAGVVSTTPVVVSTWPTLLASPSSEEGVFIVSRVGDAPARTQRLSHALGDPTPPSRHMSVASPVTAPLSKSSGHGRSGNKSPSLQGVKGKEAMEIDDNDLGHLSYGLELDDIDDDLPHSTIVRNDHDMVLEGDGMQEELQYSPAIEEKKKKQRPPHQRRPPPTQAARKKAVTDKYAVL